MPTYAYACADCGDQFDIQQSFTDDALTVCPRCSGRLRKQFGGVGVVFKGSGFYRNDSRASEKKTPAKSSATSSSSSSGDTSSSASTSPKSESSTASTTTSTSSTDAK